MENNTGLCTVHYSTVHRQLVGLYSETPYTCTYKVHLTQNNYLMRTVILFNDYTKNFNRDVYEATCEVRTPNQDTWTIPSHPKGDWNGGVPL